MMMTIMKAIAEPMAGIMLIRTKKRVVAEKPTRALQIEVETRFRVPSPHVEINGKHPETVETFAVPMIAVGMLAVVELGAAVVAAVITVVTEAVTEAEIEAEIEAGIEVETEAGIEAEIVGVATIVMIARKTIGAADPNLRSKSRQSRDQLGSPLPVGIRRARSPNPASESQPQEPNRNHPQKDLGL